MSEFILQIIGAFRSVIEKIDWKRCLCIICVLSGAASFIPEFSQWAEIPGDWTMYLKLIFLFTLGYFICTLVQWGKERWIHHNTLVKMAEERRRQMKELTREEKKIFKKFFGESNIIQDIAALNCEDLVVQSLAARGLIHAIETITVRTLDEQRNPTTPCNYRITQEAKEYLRSNQEQFR